MVTSLRNSEASQALELEEAAAAALGCVACPVGLAALVGAGVALGAGVGVGVAVATGGLAVSVMAAAV